MYREPSKPDDWMSDLDKELAKTPEEWLAEAKQHRNDLRALDAEIDVVEEQMASFEERIKSLRARRETTRRLGENAFAMIAKSMEQDK